MSESVTTITVEYVFNTNPIEEIKIQQKSTPVSDEKTLLNIILSKSSHTNIKINDEQIGSISLEDLFKKFYKVDTLNNNEMLLNDKTTPIVRNYAQFFNIKKGGSSTRRHKSNKNHRVTQRH